MEEIQSHCLKNEIMEKTKLGCSFDMIYPKLMAFVLALTLIALGMAPDKYDCGEPSLWPCDLVSSESQSLFFLNSKFE